MSESYSLPCCPRCQSIELSLQPGRAEDVSALECSSCGRRYQLRDRTLLTERWMGPLSLLLYPIALASEPLEDIDRVVRHLVDAEGWPSDTLQRSIDEAALELRSPSQQVSKILDLFSEASEDDVRTYLRQVSDRLQEVINQ